jgi:uncharacterized protein DUF4350
VKRSWAASTGALLVIALTLRLLFRSDSLEFSPTSYGALPEGYGALHDLLLELDVPVERSFASPQRLAPKATVWWIEPNDACALLGEATVRNAKIAPPNRTAVDFEAWIRAGGTAVLFTGALGDCEAKTRIADLALPGVRIPPKPPAADPNDGPVDAAIDVIRRDQTARLVTGPLVATTRQLLMPELATFSTVPEGFTVIASIDDHPFALEARVGSGRLVLAADSRFLRNRWLDRGDAAPFAFDWVHAYGVPRLDEWEHGLSETPSTVAYLAGSPALPVFAGLAASGLLFGLAGASLPRRRIDEARLGPPALDAYVDSLARLYARAGDHADVFDRYRAYGSAELRRARSLAHDAPADRIRDALRGRPGVTEADLAVLHGSVAIRGRGDLDAACAAIDRLIAVAR